MDELAWWRRRRPGRLTRADLEDLHGRLIALTPTTVDDAMPKLLQAATAEDGNAAFRIGLVLLRAHPTTRVLRDLAASWFLLCVHGPRPLRARRSDAAQLLLEQHAAEIERLRRSDRDQAGVRTAIGRRLAIAAHYVWLARSWMSAYADDLDAAQAAAVNAVDDDGAEAEADPGDRALADTPTCRVLLTDALPGPQRLDDRRLVEAYQPLLGELPLAGDPAAMRALPDQIAQTFPWATDLAAYLHEETSLRLFAGTPWFHVPPMLLVGPPGCGKTQMLRQIAEIVDVGHDLLSLGGASDARHLAGTARGWASAQPNAALVACKRHACGNPVIVLDEIEKAGGSDQGGRAHEVLLGLLEPVSARQYYDEALNCAADLSHVTWFATANDVARIPAVLQSRLRIVHVPAPTRADLDVVLAQLAGDTAADLGVRRAALPEVDAETKAALKADLDRHGDLRRVARMYRRVIAAAARQGVNRPIDA